MARRAAGKYLRHVPRFVGDAITVTFPGTNLPDCMAVVTSIDGPIVAFRYVDAAPMFAGLRGSLRLTRAQERKRHEGSV